MSTFRPESRGDSLNRSYSFVQDHKLCACNSSGQEFLRDTKWWLNLHGVGKGYPHDQKGVLETDFTLLSNGEKVNGENLLIEEYCEPFFKITSDSSCLDSPLKNCCSHPKNDEDSWLQELESIADESLLRTPLSKYTEEIWLANAHLMGFDSGDYAVVKSQKKHCSDLDLQWTELRKIEPWWNLADNDAASFASQRSSSQFRNCDLSGRCTIDVKKGSEDGIKWSDLVKEKMVNASHVDYSTVGELASEKDLKKSYVADSTMENFTSMTTDISLGKLGLKGCILQGSDGTFSGSDGSRVYKMDASDSPGRTSVDLSKPQLLEALCHSQTRAREAEKLAQQVCAEKDHIIELFFKQTSHLFAYKQWLRILQIETLCLQLGSKDHPPVLPPVPLPGICGKNSILRKNKRKVAKKKSGKRRCYLCKCAVAFAVGLALAGAGLFVGWTIGWLFPAL